MPARASTATVGRVYAATVTPVVVNRLAAAIGALLLVGCVLAAFLPTESRGDDCGTWLRPEWSAEEGRQLVRDAGAFSPERGRVARERLDACDDALDGRMVLTIGLLVAAAVVPAAAWVATSRRRPRST